MMDDGQTMLICHSARHIVFGYLLKPSSVCCIITLGRAAMVSNPRANTRVEGPTVKHSQRHLCQVAARDRQMMGNLVIITVH